MDWLALIRLEREEELERRSKQEFYLAQIACEVAKGRVKHPGQLKTMHFFVKTKREQEMDDHERMQKSKRAWAAALNIDLNKN